MRHFLGIFQHCVFSTFNKIFKHTFDVRIPICRYFMSIAFPMIHKRAKEGTKIYSYVLGHESMFMSSVQDNF